MFTLLFKQRVQFAKGNDNYTIDLDSIDFSFICAGATILNFYNRDVVSHNLSCSNDYKINTV